MDTCWKCGNALRQPNATFCHACGSAQKPDAAHTIAANPWQARLAATAGSSAAWRLLWILTGPLAIVLFPLHLRVATLRLRSHIVARLKSPAFATERFKNADEGRQITQRLAACGGGSLAFGTIIAFLLALTLLGILFLSPLAAPTGIDFGDAIGSVFEGGRVYKSVYVNSSDEYEAAWRRLSFIGQPSAYGYDQTNNGSSQYTSKDMPLKVASPPYWDESQPDTLTKHRPFEYTYSPPYDQNRPHQYRVNTVHVSSTYGRPWSILFWIGCALLYLTYLVLGVQFWRRFAQHSTTEAFAAAYARADTTMLDKLLPSVKTVNGAMVLFGVILAVTPLQLLLFPFFSALIFTSHEKWEQNSGVADALGAPVARPAKSPA